MVAMTHQKRAPKQKEEEKEKKERKKEKIRFQTTNVYNSLARVCTIKILYFRPSRLSLSLCLLGFRTAAQERNKSTSGLLSQLLERFESRSSVEDVALN
jgi:hypothetical protein